MIDERENVVHLLPIGNRGAVQAEAGTLAAEADLDRRSCGGGAEMDQMELIIGVSRDAGLRRVEPRRLAAGLLDAVTIHASTGFERNVNGMIGKCRLTADAHMALIDAQARVRTHFSSTRG